VRRLEAAFATTSALFQGGVKPPHSKALRAFSWFLGAAGGMGDWHENRSTGFPSLRSHLESIFMHSGEPKGREIFVESHVIPAKAGIHFVRNVDPRLRGGDVWTFISMGGPLAHGHSE
jgi:hypothetical protein